MKKFNYCFMENPFFKIVMCLDYSATLNNLCCIINNCLMHIIQNTWRNKNLNATYFSVYLRKVYEKVYFLYTSVY